MQTPTHRLRQHRTNNEKDTNNSILDDLIIQYWSVQNGIKKAKTEKDLERIIDLEKSSLKADDFEGSVVPSGTIVFAPNESSKTLRIKLINN